MQVFLERQLANKRSAPGGLAFPNFTLSVRNAAFRANSCLQGGALAVVEVAHSIGPNVTFEGNQATASDASGLGGAVAIRATSTLVRLERGRDGGVG